MNWNKIEPKVADLHEKVCSTMRKIEELSQSDNRLPHIESSFITAKTILDKPEYNIVVCGEVKKGKSSLLNAIVGQNVLPVNNEIATSQVFRISHSGSESFYLIFDDESSLKIDRNQLARYGSQVDANLRGEPIFGGRNLSYIQVNIPVKFLPDGVSLVDTPGLGALYKSHEWITQNYLSKASAIIFVMDSEKMLCEKEEEFIKKALEVTPNILYVLTKIDQQTPEHWNSILQSNQVYLTKLYSDIKRPAPCVYPISSKGLMSAATGNSAILNNIKLENSRFPELREALLGLIYKTIGLLRTGMAIREAADHVVKSRTVIDNMIKSLSAENVQQQQQINLEKSIAQKQLNTQWGDQSSQRNLIIKRIQAVANSTESRVRLLLSSSGPVYREYEKKICALENMDDVKSFADRMPSEISNDISSQWRNIADDIISQVSIIVSEIGAAMDDITYSGLHKKSGEISIKELSTSEKITVYRNQYFNSAFVSGLASTALVALGVVSAPVIAPIAAIGATIWGFIAGTGDKNKRAVDQNKSNFKAKLIEILNNASADLLYPPKGCVYSKVLQFQNEILDMASLGINNVYNSKCEQLQQQIKELDKQAKLSIEVRRQETEKWLSMKSKWDVFVDEIKKEVQLRNEIAGDLGLNE